MRQTYCSALALTALLTLVMPATAQEAKPAVVVSFAGYQALMDDISYIGKLTNKPGMAQQVEGLLQFFTQGQGLAGLDKARPWGAVATVRMGASGPEPAIIAFLPVTDLEALMKALAAVQPQKMDDGTWKVQNEQGAAFIRSQGNWAYVAQSAEALAKLPADPMQSLAKLDTKYDIAVQVYPQNVPQELRQMGIEQIRAAAANQQRQEGEDEDAFEARKRMVSQQMESLTTQINDIQEVTVGFSIDGPAQKVFLDVSVTPLPGSQTAAKLKAQEGLTTGFGGFVVPEAPVALSIRGRLEEETIQADLAALDSARASLMHEIDESEDLDDDQQKGIAKNIANQLIDIIAATIKTGEIDTAMSIAGEGPFTVIGATSVASPADLEKTVKSLSDIAATDPEFPQMKFNAEQYKGVRFHTMEIPLDIDADERQKAAKLIGDPVAVVFGVGERSAYLAIGANALKMLKQAIDRSEKNPAAPTDGMVALTVTVAPILKAIAEAEPNNPVVAMLAAQLQGGSDHVRVTVGQADGSQRVRIEVEEGLLKLIGAMAPSPGGSGGNNL